MKLQDVERIDDLIVQINKILRTRSLIDIGEPDDFNKVLDISNEDLEFLIQQGAITSKTGEELATEYGRKPNDLGRLREDYTPLPDHRQKLEGDAVELRNRLSLWYKLFSRKSTIEQRRKALKKVEDERRSTNRLMNDLRRRYDQIKNFLLTTRGIYITIDSNVQRYVDLAFEPTETTAPNNSIRGKLVVFSPKEPSLFSQKYLKGLYYDYWLPTTEGHDPKQYGEEVQLELNVPFERLTEVEDLNRDLYANQLGEEVIERVRLHFCEGCPSYKTYLKIGVLNFPDRRYMVTCKLISLESIKGGEEIVVGTTTGYRDVSSQDVSDREPPRSYPEPVPLELCARTIEGIFMFNLVFKRIEAYTRDEWPLDLSKPFVSYHSTYSFG